MINYQRRARPVSAAQVVKPFKTFIRWMEGNFLRYTTIKDGNRIVGFLVYLVEGESPTVRADVGDWVILDAGFLHAVPDTHFQYDYEAIND